jgi:hypothetical protein
MEEERMAETDYRETFTGEPLYPWTAGISTHTREDEFGCWVYCDESESLELFENRDAATNSPGQDGVIPGRLAVWEVSNMADAVALVKRQIGQ